MILWISLLIIITILFIVIAFTGKIKDEDDAIIFLVIFILFYIIFSFLSIFGIYKAGQIDAINGKVKYELTQKPNGEKVWKRK